MFRSALKGVAINKGGELQNWRVLVLRSLGTGHGWPHKNKPPLPVCVSRHIWLFCIKWCTHKQKGTPKIWERWGLASLQWWRGADPLEICPLPPVLSCRIWSFLGQAVRASWRRSLWKIWPLASCLSISLQVIGTDTDRPAAYDFLLTLHSNHGPIASYFQDKRRFQSKTAIFFQTIFP